MSIVESKLSSKAGLSPGSLIHVGEKKADEVNIYLVDFSEDYLEERDLDKIEDCLS